MKLDHTSLYKAIVDDKSSILLYIYGITPRKLVDNKGDGELGLTDAPWMGLIPTFTDITILDVVKSPDGLSLHNNDSAAISKHLTDAWSMLKSLILGRATGLHRVIRISGKEIEKFFIKTLA